MELPRSARELTDEDEELVALAKATIDANTDAGPDEDGIHTMGAAVRAADGRMFPAVNVYHFTGGPCAELVALGAARAAGARDLTTIVAVGNHGRGPVSPCGRDRQVLFDYHPDIRVILPTERGVLSICVRDLMPLASLWTVDGGTQAYDPALRNPDVIAALEQAASGHRSQLRRRPPPRRRPGHGSNPAG
ncbi:MAG: cytidine deaminase family protein [Acidimicrobiales bacterium]